LRLNKIIMGILRLLLAFVVVIAHTPDLASTFIIGGDRAVSAFFIVSGFYMALILSEKYTHSNSTNLGLFYSNRALRILPLLWIVLIFEIGAALMMNHLGFLSPSHWLRVVEFLFDKEQYALLSTYAFTQVSGFGVDVPYLISLSPDGLPHWYNGPVKAGELRGWQAYPMGHAWSISCELIFYLLAPALNYLRTRTLGVFVVASVAVNFFAPWMLSQPLANVASSFLAPFQMGFFVLGMLSYRLYKTPFLQRGGYPVAVRFFIIGGLGLCLFLFEPLSRLSYHGSLICLYGSVTMALPFLFGISRKSKWDTWLGNFSYPIYLTHVTVLQLLDCPPIQKFFGPHFHGTIWHALAALMFAVLLSWLLIRFFDQRIDHWRQRRAAASTINAPTKS
jgi:peptidoglycan/LPS O-acetylase OafA/YrhL